MISKKLKGRTDIDEYAYSLEELGNFLVEPMGGVSSRPGTTAVLTSDTRVTVIPWERADAVYFITFEQVPVTPYPRFGFRVFDTNWASISQLVSPFFGRLKNIDGTETALPSHLELIEHQTEGGVVFETLDFDGFRSVTIDNSIVILHNSGKMPPIVFSILTLEDDILYRIEHYQFTGQLSVEGQYGLGQYYNGEDASAGFYSTPYLPNKTEITLVPSITVPGGQAGKFTTSLVQGTLTAAGPSIGATPFAYFTEEMKYTFFILTQGNKESTYMVTSITSPTVAQVTCFCYGLDATTKTRNFRRQLFSPDLGFPKVMSIHNQRLYFANTLTKPNWFFGSRLNHHREIVGLTLYQFLTDFPITGETSTEFSISSREYGEITWIETQGDMVIGTTSHEYSVTAETNVSALDITVKAESSIGGAPVQTCRNSESAFFVSGDGKTIRKVQYNFEVRGYRTQSISILNEDIIFRPRAGQVFTSESATQIRELLWQESNRTMWVLTTTNNLFSVGIEPSSDTMAWAYHEFGGEAEVMDIFHFRSRGLKSIILGLVIRRGAIYTTEYMLPQLNGVNLDPNSEVISDLPIEMDCSYIARVSSDEIIMDGYILLDIYDGYIGSLTPQDFVGIQQTVNTGMEFEVTAMEYPDANFYVGAKVYLIINNIGYGFPDIQLAATEEDAYLGNFIAPTANVSDITFKSTNVQTGFKKWGQYLNLIGQTVDVIGDGELFEDIVVDSKGILTLPKKVNRVIVGYRFESTLITNTPDIGGTFGSAQGSLKRVDRTYIRYDNTRTAVMGTKESNLEPVIFPELPFTGAMEHFIDSTTEIDYKIILKKKQSLPMNIMSITLRGKSDE